MRPLQEAESLISTMTASEKAQLLRWIARDFDGSSPGVESDPTVAGGEPCILRTRIPVWVLVQARKFGAGEAELLNNYPDLCAEDLVNAWGYYRMHKADIDQQIAENEEA